MIFEADLEALKEDLKWVVLREETVLKYINDSYNDFTAHYLSHIDVIAHDGKFIDHQELIQDVIYNIELKVATDFLYKTR